MKQIRVRLTNTINSEESMLKSYYTDNKIKGDCYFPHLNNL